MLNSSNETTVNLKFYNSNIPNKFPFKWLSASLKNIWFYGKPYPVSVAILDFNQHKKLGKESFKDNSCTVSCTFSSWELFFLHTLKWSYVKLHGPTVLTILDIWSQDIHFAREHPRSIPAKLLSNCSDVLENNIFPIRTSVKHGHLINNKNVN